MSRGDLINIVSALAIVAGLILVLVELRQSRDIAEAQLEAGVNDTILNFNLALFGENAAAVQAKACHRPDELTPADRETLIAFNRALLMRTLSMLRIRNKGLFPAERDVEEFSRGNAMGFLGTPWGRYQWSKDRVWVSAQYPQLARTFDEVMDSIPKGTCSWKNDHSEYLQKLADGAI